MRPMLRLRSFPVRVSLATMLHLLLSRPVLSATDAFIGSFAMAAGEAKKLEFDVERGYRDDAYKGSIQLGDQRRFPLRRIAI